MRTLGSRNQPRSYHKKEQETIKISLDELPKHEKSETQKKLCRLPKPGNANKFQNLEIPIDIKFYGNS